MWEVPAVYYSPFESHNRDDQNDLNYWPQHDRTNIRQASETLNIIHKDLFDGITKSDHLHVASTQAALMP